ncbi:MAG TPA: SRPBCC domain-containing protein [Vicinamibacterales bacterium]|nr:SRPBCC domain-containing protein [Vicinamibacterales bacterium]
MPAIIQEPIAHEILIAAPPERVYDAFATASGLDAWFTSGAEVDARAGGSIKFRWRDWGPRRLTMEDGGAVLAAQRPSHLIFEWHPGGPGFTTVVALTFERVAVGTVARVRETGYPDTPEGRRAMLDCAAGWGEALALARVYVERGMGRSPTS